MPSYRIRHLTYHGRKCSVLLQDVNGPCPLIAIINVLSLRGLIQLPQQDPSNQTGEPEYLDSKQARALVSSHCANLVAKSFEESSLSDSARANVLQNFEDLTQLLDRIEVGLDLNPCLNDCFSFEFTREVGLFDACEIRIAHGWTYDPQDELVAQSIGSMNYNEATTLCALHDDKVQQLKNAQSNDQSSSSNNQSNNQSSQSNNPSNNQSNDQSISQSIDPSQQQRVTAIETWLRDNPTQMTIHGLSSLCVSIKEDELFILLRNSHFNVVTKHEGELYLLVTDEGLISSCPVIAWNRIVDVDGSDVFCDQRFRVPTQAALETSMQQQIDPQTANIHTHMIDQSNNQSNNQQPRSRSPSPNPSSLANAQYRPVQPIAQPMSYPSYQQQQPVYQQPEYLQGYPPMNPSNNQSNYSQQLHPSYQQFYPQQQLLSPNNLYPVNQSINQTNNQSNYQYPVAQTNYTSPAAPQRYQPRAPSPNLRQPQTATVSEKRNDSCSIM